MVSEHARVLDFSVAKKSKENRRIEKGKDYPPRRTLNARQKEKKRQKGEKGLTVGLRALRQSAPPSRAAPVPLDPDAHRQAEASGRRTHPSRGKVNHRSRTVRRRRAHREGNALPAKGMATVREEKGGGKGGWNGAVVVIVVFSSPSVTGERRNPTLNRSGRRRRAAGEGGNDLGFPSPGPTQPF